MDRFRQLEGGSETDHHVGGSTEAHHHENTEDSRRMSESVELLTHSISQRTLMFRCARQGMGVRRNEEPLKADPGPWVIRRNNSVCATVLQGIALLRIICNGIPWDEVSNPRGNMSCHRSMLVEAEETPVDGGRTRNLFLKDYTGQMKALKLATLWNDILIGWK